GRRGPDAAGARRPGVLPVPADARGRSRDGAAADGACRAARRLGGGAGAHHERGARRRRRHVDARRPPARRRRRSPCAGARRGPRARRRVGGGARRRGRRPGHRLPRDAHGGEPGRRPRRPAPARDGRGAAAAAVTGLERAHDAVAQAAGVVAAAAARLGAAGDLDAHQAIAYDREHAAAGVEAARAVLAYGEQGEVEARLACAFVADAVHDFAARALGREALFGGRLDDAVALTAEWRDPAYLAALCGEAGPRHLDADFEMVQSTFRRFADEQVRPVAEEVHRTNADIPEHIISGLAEIGTFGLSIPAEYGGFSEGGEGEYLAMVVRS